MNKEELQNILELHKKWVDDPKKGKQANLRGADLRDADLRGINLSFANLQETDLRGVDLSGANLTFSALSGADLRGANFSGADLSSSNMSRTRLGYKPPYTVLEEAKVEGAIFTGAQLAWAIFPATAAVNLDEQRIVYFTKHDDIKPVVGRVDGWVVEYDETNITLNSGGAIMKFTRDKGVILILELEQEQKVEIEQEQTKNKERSGIER
jgi:hypothetical protein